jgi:GMP synthase (glutamine-hydrolysing)
MTQVADHPSTQTAIPTISQDRILILDFGSQYSQLIARRVREAGVYCEMYAYDMDDADIRAFNPKGIILSGGPESVTADASPRAPKIVFNLGVPVLGICYGMQTMAAQLGGSVENGLVHEFGRADVTIQSADALFAGIEDAPNKLHVWMSHGDKVNTLPPQFIVSASTPTCPIAAMSDVSRRFFGVQFHPEVTHTNQGEALLKRFVLDICGARGLWTPEHIIDLRIEQLRQQIGSEKVLLGLSGGVDSSVVANGLLRLNEGDDVMTMFAGDHGMKVIRANAQERFLSELTGVTDPEAKRKIIGRVFIEVFAEEARKLDGVKFLAQGTIYPDVIESAASKQGKAHVIKSHHNVGGLPADLDFELVEPLRDLFKDEVRKLGTTLGLPHSMIYRHPFPGPGLGVRILGEVKQEYADILRRADAIFMEELRKSGWYDKTAQAFAVFQPIKSVGVVGDARRYAWVIALRAVETVDFMTARFAHLPYDLIEVISNRIMNEIAEVSRVVYDVSSKPPATIEWE